jgi:hypothetical protein
MVAVLQPNESRRLAGEECSSRDTAIDDSFTFPNLYYYITADGDTSCIDFLTAKKVMLHSAQIEVIEKSELADRLMNEALLEYLVEFSNPVLCLFSIQPKMPG